MDELTVEPWFIVAGIAAGVFVVATVWAMRFLVRARREVEPEVDPATLDREWASRRIAAFREQNTPEASKDSTGEATWPTPAGSMPRRAANRRTKRGLFDTEVSEEVARADRILNQTGLGTDGPAKGRQAAPSSETEISDPLSFLSLDDDDPHRRIPDPPVR
jgi:hypothetical protein